MNKSDILMLVVGIPTAIFSVVLFVSPFWRAWKISGGTDIDEDNNIAETAMTTEWIPTTSRPIGQKKLPPERKVVLLWMKGKSLPFLGYLRYAAGDRECPYWVCYTWKDDEAFEVAHYADCLPINAPEGVKSVVYEMGQAV